MQTLELLDAAVGAQLGEQAAAADALELAVIADQRRPPPVACGQVDELVQGGSRQHPGLVDDQRCACRQLELGAG